MKKAIGLVDLGNGSNKKFIDNLVTTMHGMKAIVDDMLVNSVTYDTLKEVFRFSDDSMAVEKFEKPLEIQESHVRHFFSKMQKGQFAVQRYRGYKVNSPAELMHFFTSTVGKKAYGDDWLEKEFMETFEDYPQGVYTVSDINHAQAKQLKALLGNDFAIVLVGQTEEGTDVPQERDAYIQAASKNTKTQLKEITEGLLNNIKAIWEGKDVSQSTTAKRVVRSRFNEAGGSGEPDTVREDTEGRS